MEQIIVFFMKTLTALAYILAMLSHSFSLDGALLNGEKAKPVGKGGMKH